MTWHSSILTKLYALKAQTRKNYYQTPIWRSKYIQFMKQTFFLNARQATWRRKSYLNQAGQNWRDSSLKVCFFPQIKPGLLKWVHKWIIHILGSVQFSRFVVSDSLPPHVLQYARPPCPSPTPRVHPNPCPLSRWCHPTISSSAVPFSSCPQSFPASGSFQMSQFFASSGQSFGVSASPSVLPMNIQDWSLLGWTDWISLQSKGLSRVFSNTTVQKHQFFSTQLSL